MIHEDHGMPTMPKGMSMKPSKGMKGPGRQTKRKPTRSQQRSRARKMTRG